MKLLFAYDGSSASDAALDDLTHAGLPTKGEALVMTVAESWLAPPPPSSYEIVEMAAVAKGPMALERKYMAGSQAVKEAGMLAAQAAERIRANFPGWEIKHESVWGSANWELFAKAESWDADLIVVGAHGHSVLGRLFLGSISQWLLHNADCSIRVARGKLDEPDFPVRLVVGLDGSANANDALNEVCTRNWPDRSEVQVVVVDQALEPTVVGEFIPLVKQAVAECDREENAQSRKLVDAAAKKLRARGLRAYGLVEPGEPKKVLTRLAEEWRADCIFLGATGITGRFERFLLGSTAAAVAARASCSVEIVRKRKGGRRTNGNGKHSS